MVKMVTSQGDDELVTAQQAQLRRIIAAEHRAGQIRPAQRSGVHTPVAAAWLAVIGTPCSGRELAGPRTSGDPRAGLPVYKFAGCASCHALAGISVGNASPSLDGEGRRRGASRPRAMLPAHLHTTARRSLSARDLGGLISYLTSLR